MTVRRVLKMGDPLLYRKAQAVSAFDTPELHALIGDMFDTMAPLSAAMVSNISPISACSSGVSNADTACALRYNSGSPIFSTRRTVMSGSRILYILRHTIEKHAQGKIVKRILALIGCLFITVANGAPATTAYEIEWLVVDSRLPRMVDV